MQPDSNLTRFDSNGQRGGGIGLPLLKSVIQITAMPIRPEHRWLYPIDWLQVSFRVRFTRARGKCDHCRRPHGHEVRHLGDGLWWDQDTAQWRNGRGKVTRIGALVSQTYTTRVVLACAHLNHDPTDNRDRNLAALCQRCHMIHDGPEHRRRRWQNAFRMRALGDLFLGRYPLIS